MFGYAHIGNVGCWHYRVFYICFHQSTKKHNKNEIAIKARHSPPYGGGARGWGFAGFGALGTLGFAGVVFFLLLLRWPYILNLQLHHIALEHIVLNSICYVEAAF